MALPSMRAKRGSRSCFTTVTLCVLAGYLLADLQASDMLDGEALLAFAAPGYTTSLKSSVHAGVYSEAGRSSSQKLGWGVQRTAPTPSQESNTARTAGYTMAEMGSRCISAMGAGAVASIIQAALSAVAEPIVNRVLVRRMKIMDAINDVSPAQMLNFFKTTLVTNFLKFPFFEVITAILFCLNLPPAIRGIVTGLVFTTCTLPVTNYRYRKSMELPIEFSKLYEAYPPTLLRDMAYGISRNYLTGFYIAAFPGTTPGSPQLLFPVVVGACLLSAPFNEWRGYLLQSKGKELTFEEFFKPSNFVRSTSLGAVKQGLALALGYWAAPPVKAFVSTVIASFK